MSKPHLSSASAARVPAWAAWLALVLAALFSLQGALFWLFRDRGPTHEAHVRAGDWLRARFAPGDVIFTVPGYATEGHERVGDLHPLAVREPLAEDLGPYRRAWVYALYGEEDATRARFEAAGHEHLEREHFDGVVVDGYRLKGQGEEVMWDGLAALDGAHVRHVHADGRVEACAQRRPHMRGGLEGDRWVCPHDGDWFYVGPEHHYMGETVRTCLWAHPPAEGRLEISYSDVPAGSSLAVWGGHTLNASRRAHAPVELDVRVGPKTHQTFIFDLADTWREVRLPLTSTRSATVTFAVSSSDNGANHFCFAPSVRASVKRP